ncbi:MAG: PaaI family thioesterase [Vicinamibacteria bacterium]|nr:PaaI family thioesterase [Vicinamibacteria bacterium]
MVHDDDKRTLLPWSRSCFVCGESNPQGLRARLYQVGDTTELSFVPRPEFAGWSNVVHGGLISTVLDEVMTWAAIVFGRQGYFSAEFNVRLRKPLPPETKCVARARVLGERRRILDAEGRLEGADNTLFATAKGRYLPVPPGKMAEFRHDFVWSEECLDLRSVFEK